MQTFWRLLEDSETCRAHLRIIPRKGRAPSLLLRLLPGQSPVLWPALNEVHAYQRAFSGGESQGHGVETLTSQGLISNFGVCVERGGTLEIAVAHRPQVMKQLPSQTLPMTQPEGKKDILGSPEPIVNASTRSDTSLPPTAHCPE